MIQKFVWIKLCTVRLAMYCAVLSFLPGVLWAQIQGVAAQKAPKPAAESPSLSPALNLEKAFELALSTHPLVRQRKGNIDASQDDIRAAQWKWFPTLTVETSQTVGGQPQVLGNNDNGATTFKLEQPLLTSGRITTEVDLAQARKRIAHLQLYESEQELLMKVLQSYMDYQRLNARLKIARENLDEHQRLFDLISRRQQQQVTSEADVALAKARVQQVRTELAAMLSTQRNARLSLEQLTGQVFVDAVLLEEPADRAKVWSDEFAAQTAAREASPLLQRLMAEVRLNEVDVNNRKTLLLPQLNLRHERFLGSAAVVPFDRTMVVLQYQPGSGASVLPGIDAAVKRIGSAQFAYEAGARELAEKVSAQLNEVASLTGQLDFTRQYAESSQEVMASYLRQYTAARKTWIEVLNAQRELAQARYTAIDTTYGLKLAFYKLDILTGVIHKSPHMK